MKIQIPLLAMALFAAQHAEARIIVQLKPGANASQVQALFNSHGMHLLKQNNRLHVQVLDHNGYSTAQAVAALRGNPLIQYVEEDKLVKAIGTPNDPDYPNEWHIPKIGANTAWSYNNGGGIKVAVLDTGVTAVQDLSANLIGGTNVVSPSSGTADVYGHGTAVAGTIAAVCNNGMGVAGVACGAKIMPVVIANSQGQAYLSDIATGIQWAADNGARVINISYDNLTNSQTIDNAAQYARSKNAGVVTAAGNSGNNPGFTTNDPYLFTVSATDSNDALATFSSYGPYVDLSAPGVGIWTTNRDGTYGSWNGTSFASPVVAATEAMMLAANPALTPAQVEQTLENTATDLGAAGYDPYYGYGRVNAAAAVQAATNQSSTPAPSPSPAPTGDTTAPTISMNSPVNNAYIGSSTTISGSCSDNVGVVKLQLIVDGNLLATSTASSGQYFTGYSWSWSGYSLGTHALKVVAFDAAGNTQAATATVYRLY